MVASSTVVSALFPQFDEVVPGGAGLPVWARPLAQRIAERFHTPAPGSEPEAPGDPELANLNLTPEGEDPGEEQFQTEISDYVSFGDSLFILSSGGGSTLQVTDATDPSNPELVERVTLEVDGEPYTSQSVATHENLVAVALSPADYNTTPAPGVVRFYEMQPDGSLTFLHEEPVGYLPDSIAFTDDGSQLVIANEGQPNWGEEGPANEDGPTYPDAYTVDPEGSIGIIDLSTELNPQITALIAGLLPDPLSAAAADLLGPLTDRLLESRFAEELDTRVPLLLQPSYAYTDLGFEDVEIPPDVRISGPAGTTAAQDIEPEYVTIEGDVAYVTLQENNGIAVVDLTTRTIEGVYGLGTLDYSGIAVDLTDRPSGTFQPLLGQDYEGLRMTDGVDAFETGGGSYLITANEGDSRVYADNDNAVYVDEERNPRVKTIVDDVGVSDTTTNTTFGSRSVSIFDTTSGELVWDSGNSLQTIAVASGTYSDSRSDDKGVEPESVVVAEIDGRSYAIVGMERGTASTLAVFDVTDPANTVYVTHTVLEESISPEGLLLVPAEDSPTGSTLLVVSNEVTNSLDFIDLEALIETPGPGSAGSYEPTMLQDVEGGPELDITSLITTGEFTNCTEPGSSVYAPPGIFDGMGAYDNGDGTYTLLVNSEISAGLGYPYLLNGEAVTGARINKLIIDKDIDDDPSNGYQSEVISAGLAYDTVVGGDTNGFDRFCSANLVEADSFGEGIGFEDRIYLVGEETSANGGGAMYALDEANGTLYEVEGVGKGAWESATLVDTGSPDTVGMLLFDDGSAAPTAGSPLYLWVGTKEPDSDDFLRRNGLDSDQGALYVWTASSVENTPAGLNGVDLGTPVSGGWQLVGTGEEVASGDYRPEPATGEPPLAPPTAQEQRDYSLDTLGAMQFLRIEDGDVNPADGSLVAFNTTGGAYSGQTDNGDYYGNVYTMDFSAAFAPDGQLAPTGTTTLRVVVDADRLGDDAITGARNPDNIAWSGDGYLYVQEDKSTLNGTDPGQFGPEEASIWQVDPVTGETVRWAQIDRSSVPSEYGQTDSSPDVVGTWESSGIIDVSSIYGEDPGSVFLSTVQAHSLTDGNLEGGTYLVEGGQINLIQEDSWS
ncbi:hypothetical protein BBFGKLBO_00182 [Synechococcus sp. CBW1107]|uniref:choice-of-anchor I domain-containing protein n=1 Tax=Synechococcus sp. CBW1107 TaxID=2789857 RepID=UPI002AD34172|nr:hypothetical protein [Synechococcus sp. CBW1107]CAK6687281.1 hypothetical protein BBFGKLBO_00182 [Synechococcus sp. CBW1107]